MKASGISCNMSFRSSCYRDSPPVSDNVDQDQTARFVQSDLDLHCPQKGY